MNTKLVQLGVHHGIAEYRMLQDIGAEEFGFSNEVNGMTFEQYRAWLVCQTDYAMGRHLPSHWIPQTTYFLYAGAYPVGIGRIRHFSSKVLESRGVGNLGYGIASSYRGQGYGTLLFSALLAQCKGFGYQQIKLFPDASNTATVRIMEKHGAKLLGTLGSKLIFEIDVNQRAVPLRPSTPKSTCP